MQTLPNVNTLKENSTNLKKREKVDPRKMKEKEVEEEEERQGREGKGKATFLSSSMYQEQF